MKRVKNILFLSILSFLFIQPVYGQKFLKRFSDKVIDKAENRLEKKADEKVDKGLDRLEEKIDENSEADKEDTHSPKTNVKNMLNSFGISSDPVPVESKYHFSHLIEMQITSYNKNGKLKDDGVFITLLNPDSKCMAYQSVPDKSNKNESIFIIIDSENGATVLLSEEKGKKTGVVYGMGAYFATLGQSIEENEQVLSDTPDNYLANPNINKTGRTKTIAGLKCEEYTYKDEQTESSIWITKDMKLNTQDFFSTLFKTSLLTHGLGWGYMMEATSTDLESGEKSMMQVVKVDDNSNKSFALSDYEITNLGSFKPPVTE